MSEDSELNEYLRDEIQRLKDASLQLCERAEEQKKYMNELENRLRALWDKLEGERKYYNEHIRQLELAGNAMYAFINPPSPSMRTTRMDNLLQGWDDAKIGKEAKP